MFRAFSSGLNAYAPTVIEIILCGVSISFPQKIPRYSPTLKRRPFQKLGNNTLYLLAGVQLNPAPDKPRRLASSACLSLS